MNQIQHGVRIKGSRDDVFRAISTIDGLSSWWTRTTTGTSQEGKTIDFRFGNHVTSMKVTSLDPGKKVVWTCISSNPDWLKTEVHFELGDADDGVALAFAHHKWREANPFFAHCSMKWATFLLSLKQYVETGTGAPFPDDIAI